MSAIGGSPDAARQANGWPKLYLHGASDERLTLEMSRGDEFAFRLLYDRHSAGLSRLCRGLLGSHEEAEDAMQQVMASVWWQLQKPRAQLPERVRPWLYAAARHRCLAMLKSRGPGRQELLDVPAPLDVGEEVERRLELRAVLRDVADLPYEQRSALLLSELRGLSHADVADVLGRREPAIKSLVFEARRRLGDWREARDLPCAEVRRQLLELRGGSLRRRSLRRHLQLCSSCHEFRRARAPRGVLSVSPLLPVLSRLSQLSPPGDCDGLASLGLLAVAGTVAIGGLAIEHSAVSLLGRHQRPLVASRAMAPVPVSQSSLAAPAGSSASAPGQPLRLSGGGFSLSGAGARTGSSATSRPAVRDSTGHLSRRVQLRSSPGTEPAPVSSPRSDDPTGSALTPARQPPGAANRAGSEDPGRGADQRAQSTGVAAGRAHADIPAKAPPARGTSGPKPPPARAETGAQAPPAYGRPVPKPSSTHVDSSMEPSPSSASTPPAAHEPARSESGARPDVAGTVTTGST